MSKDKSKPTQGERSGGQVQFMYDSIFSNYASPKGLFSTYRRMRANPTIALARSVFNAPIRLANFSVEADDGVNTNIKEFVEKQIEYIWPELIKNIVYAMDYGFQSYEKVWELINDDGQRWRLKKLKPLSPDKIIIQVDKKTGAFSGLTQNAVNFPISKVFHFVYDGEPGNWYGRSKHENVREDAWYPWTEIAKKEVAYAAKVAGVLPIVRYPIGTSRDKTGSEKSNYEIATEVLNNLGQGKGIAMPQQLLPWMSDLPRQGLDPEQFAAWQISFLEPKGQHGTGFVEMLRHYESLIMRGELVPERAAIEGQHGTKAESAEHGEKVLISANLVLEEVFASVNWYVINPILRYNFGEEYENKVRVVKTGIDSATTLFFRELMKAVLSNPSNIELFVNWVDVDTVLDVIGIPKIKETIENIIPTKDGEENILTPEQLRSVNDTFRSIIDKKNGQGDKSAGTDGN